MPQDFVTKDGRAGTLCPAVEKDAADLIRAIDSVAREQVYFLRSSYEVEITDQRAFITQVRERGGLLLLARVEGKLVGWVSLYRADREFLRHTAGLGMGVIRDYRGLGVGRLMLDYILKWAAGHGIEKVKLGVRAGNARARALYHKIGFVEEGYRLREIKDQEGQYDDDVEMAYFVPQTPPLPVDEDV